MTVTIRCPDLKKDVDLCIKRFQRNLEDTRLDNHSLNKRMEGKWVFSVTGDLRIVYKWLGKNSVRLLAIGTHEEVYE